MRRNDDITILREMPGDVPGLEGGGFAVIHVTREMGRFSVTYDHYTSRRAYELGNTAADIGGGADNETIAKLAPELAPIIALHLCDVESGEPMHGPANGWYRLSGGDMAYELEQRESRGYPNYHDAPEPYDEEGWLNPEFAEFFLGIAARCLLCTVEELPNVQDEELYDDWITDMRWRWRALAQEANEWIDAHENEVEQPSEITDEDEFSVELEAGLRVSAKLSDETGYREGVGSFNWYDIEITNGSYTYTTRFGGSVSDYNEGRINAREAAMNTTHELAEFLDRGAREMAEDFGIELGDDASEEERDTFERMQRAEEAADELSAALNANRVALGA